MALHPDNTADSGPRAPIGLGLDTSLAMERSNSSNEELQESNEEQNEEVGSMVGVSIGREQTRLTSPNTPALEKVAAIDRSAGFFDLPNEELYDGTGEQHFRKPAAREVTESFHKADTRPTARWQAESKRGAQSRSILKDGFFNRKRSSSGSGTFSNLMSSLPSLPKGWTATTSGHSSPGMRSTDGSVSNLRQQSDRQGAIEAEESPVPSPELHEQSPSPGEREEATSSVGALPTRPKLEPLRTRPSQLRRSASDSSLGPMRTLSTVSSLGDDSRWEGVHEQVNSRFKALKDSFQDSNIKLPSLSGFSLANFTPDFLRERSNSGSQKTPPIDPLTRQPYHSSKSAVQDVTSDKIMPHPQLHQAMNDLEGDIVILGGYRGSILRSAEPPHRQIWVPVKVGLNLRKVDLEVGIEEGSDERATEKVIPDGMLTHIGPVDMSRRLFKRLRACDNAKSGVLRVHDYGYDWRLHPDFLSQKLIQFLETLRCNQGGTPKHNRGAIVIAHSLGGLITRHAVNQRPELFKGVVYAGVPKGCVNILGPLRNGDDVLLSSRVLTAQVNFTIRTSFALLPLDGRCFVDKDTKEEYRVDFFDPKTWIDYRLSPCVARPLPALSAPAKPTGLAGYVNSISNALPSLPLRARKDSVTRSRGIVDGFKTTAVENMAAEPDSTETAARRNIDDSSDGQEGQNFQIDESAPVRTAVTIPREDAIDYLTRTLARVKKFKQELAFNKAHATSNIYPPVSLIYGKSVPTVLAARVHGRDGIKRADAYENLTFGSGDGVVLAKASMLPEGYTVARGGVARTERGHVTMLGDLEAVAKCLNAVMAARQRGVGLGRSNE